MVGGKIVYGCRRFRNAWTRRDLPPAMPDWSPVRSFGGLWGLGRKIHRRQAGGSATHGHGLQLRQCVRHPWPRPRGCVVKPIAGCRSEIVLGRARLRLLGGLIGPRG